MPLLELWSSNPDTISSFTIEQIVSSAGDGKLKDNSTCSNELRKYLSQIKSDKLSEYIEYCLSKPFNKSGMVLQDLVNELGRRLDYQVTNGSYQGSSNKIGYDGIWVSPEHHCIVLEVKTTDAYRISLDNIDKYRKELLEQKRISLPSSILITVGREDTGELEAQVRGSRHAWDMRLISSDALSKLVKLKESTDESNTARKIREILVPMEYTKLDSLIETIFTAAQDVERSVSSETQETAEVATPTKPKKEKSGWEFTDSTLIQTKRETIIEAIGKKTSVKFVKKTRAMYWDASHEIRLVCTISKRYEKSDNQRYWYAYHPQWNEFLSAGKMGDFVLGCMDLDIAFVIPIKKMQKHLDNFNTTMKEESNIMYWHIVIAERSKGKYELVLPKISDLLNLEPFVLHAQ